jgi:large subunit ribosomal protein L21e
MSRQKNIRQRGKIRLSEYFKELKEGDKVALVRELSEKTNFHKRLQGKTGRVYGKRGNSYIIQIMDGNKEKRIIIKPIHLKKLNS